MIIIKNKLEDEKCSLLYRSVFIGKEDPYPNYPLNICYWVLKIGKDIFKWIYSVSLLKENKALFILLFISPVLKYILIGLGSLDRFKKNFYRIKVLILFIIILLIIEAFFELPNHFLFQVNKIYLHTNYYRIYDIRERALRNILIEIVESFVVFGFIIYYFIYGKFHYSALVTIILVTLELAFFFYAFIFYCVYDRIEVNNLRNKRHEIMEEEKKKVKDGSVNVNINNSNYHSNNYSTELEINTDTLNNSDSISKNNNYLDEKASNNYFFDNIRKSKTIGSLKKNNNNKLDNINSKNKFSKSEVKKTSSIEEENSKKYRDDFDSKDNFKNRDEGLI